MFRTTNNDERLAFVMDKQSVFCDANYKEHSISAV
jgi:hypothetical protein